MPNGFSCDKVTKFKIEFNSLQFIKSTYYLRSIAIVNFLDPKMINIKCAITSS